MSPVQRPPLPSIGVKNRNREARHFLDLENMDPTREYRWVRCRADEHHMSVTTSKMHGYILEHWSKEGVRPLADIEESERRPDGVIAIGDLVLMSISKLDYEASQRAQHARTEALLASTSAQTEQMAKDKGIKVMKDPDHDHNTVEIR